MNNIHLVTNMSQIIKVQRPVSSALISGLYHWLVSYIRGHIYNSFAGGIIVQKQEHRPRVLDARLFRIWY